MGSCLHSDSGPMQPPEGVIPTLKLTVAITARLKGGGIVFGSVALVKRKAGETNSEGERAVQRGLLRRRNRPDELVERRLRKTHQLITVDAAFVLEPFIDSDIDLGMDAVTA